MRCPYCVVDAFTGKLFGGNPAAVVLLPHWPADGWLQSVAMEMNLSETAFLVGESPSYDLRWFTPKIEVDLCGHATLAAAAALVDWGKIATPSQTGFATRSGPLGVKWTGDNFVLDFPVVRSTPCTAPAGLVEALGVQPRNIERNKFDYLVEVGTRNEVKHAAPNMGLLRTIDCRGIILTARDDSAEFDFVSRFFAPAAGVDEDPVTGSAHCCLADYWQQRLKCKNMVGYQASARGGIVRVSTHLDRVSLQGQGVVFARGEIDLPESC